MILSSAVAAVDCCLTISDSAEHIERARRMVGNPCLDWLAVAALANKHLVGPALWTSLSRPRLQELVPEDVQNYLALLHAENGARNLRIHSQCLDIGAAFARAGVRAALLKGAAWLFDGSAPAAADRMMRDIDLAVVPQQSEAAVQVLAACGYREADTILAEQGHFHHAPLVREEAEASVEVHRDLAHRAELLTTSEMIAAAKTVAPGLLLPARRHRIVHNVIHSQILNGNYAGGAFDVRDGLDLARLVSGCDPEFDWTALKRDGRERGYLRYLVGALHAAHRILGSPLPAPVANSLAGRVHGWRCAQQHRWPRVGKILEMAGPVARAFAWDRNAYPLGIGQRRSPRARLSVNRQRIRRALAAVRAAFSP